MKKIVLGLLSMIASVSYSEIKLKINEPMRFEAVNLTTMSDAVIGRGSIEIYTDNLEEDYGKKIVFKFQDTGLMTNKKRWLKVEKYMMEDKDKNVIIENKRRVVNIYAVIDRATLNNGKMEAKFVEGEYVGYIPVIASQYSKIIGKKENKPQKEEVKKK